MIHWLRTSESGLQGDESTAEVEGELMELWSAVEKEKNETAAGAGGGSKRLAYEPT